MRRFQTQVIPRSGAVSTYVGVAVFVLMPCAARGRAGARLAHARARAATAMTCVLTIGVLILIFVIVCGACVIVTGWP